MTLGLNTSGNKLFMNFTDPKYYFEISVWSDRRWIRVTKILNCKMDRRFSPGTDTKLNVYYQHYKKGATDLIGAKAYNYLIYCTVYNISHQFKSLKARN